MTYQNIVDDLPIGELINTEKSPFWYKAGKYPNLTKFGDRYQHEKGKTGDRFLDGNNGDSWKVLAINTEYHRAIVENLSQGGRKFVFWD